MPRVTSRVDDAKQPTADRPLIPAAYGVPKSTKGLRTWDEVEARLEEATVYWVATCGARGQPRVRPVDGIYLDGSLYFGGSPAARWARELRANPQICIHLDGGHDVVILEGTAVWIDPGMPIELAEALAASSKAKYGFGPSADEQRASGLWAFRPSVAVAWKQFPKDATRFRFERPDGA